LHFVNPQGRIIEVGGRRPFHLSCRLILPSIHHR
jgi:hypothetical protein